MGRLNLTPQQIGSIRLSPKGQLPPFLQKMNAPKMAGMEPTRESLRANNVNRVKAGKQPFRVYKRPILV